MTDKVEFEAKVRKHLTETYAGIKLAPETIFTDNNYIHIHAMINGKTFSVHWGQWDIVFTLEGEEGFKDSEQEKSWGPGFNEDTLIGWIDTFVDAYIIRGITIDDRLDEAADRYWAIRMTPEYRQNITTLEQVKAMDWGMAWGPFDKLVRGIMVSNPKKAMDTILQMVELDKEVKLSGEALDYFLANGLEFYIKN